jgi:hypothetical protein
MKASKNKPQGSGWLLTLAGSLSVAFASPQISVDSSTFDLGTIYEGKMPSATHAFKVKNTGDSILRIQQVKPG